MSKLEDETTEQQTALVGASSPSEWMERRLEAQYRVLRALAEADVPSQAMPAVLQTICECLGWEVALVWQVDFDQKVLKCLAVWQAKHSPAAAEFEAASRLTTFERGVGLPGRVWESGRATWVDVTNDRNFPRAPAALADGIHGGVGFPIRSRAKVLGVIEAYSRRSREPEPGVIEVMDAFGDQIGQFIDRSQAEQSLKESEARKSAIFEAALDCIITMDHRGRVTEFNPAAETTFGYSRSEAIGRQLAELIIPPEFRQAHYDGLARYVETREGPVLGRRIEIEAVRADGSRFPVELAITPVDVSGPPLFTGYLRDITERKLAEEERARLLESNRVALAEAEAAQWRLAFLAEASTRVAAALDYQSALQSLAHLAVPVLADWCMVDLMGDDSAVHRVAIAQADPEKTGLADELRALAPEPEFDRGILHVLRSGEALLTPDLSTQFSAVRDISDRRRVIEEMGPRSALIVPLVARGRTLGALTLIYAESGRTHSEEDLVLAQDLARRAAVPIDNVRLFQEVTHVARVLQRTLLPPHLPKIQGLELAGRYEAASEGVDVGGDFYDVFRAGRRRWAVVIGDVSGKGADAAALTGMARYTLRATPIEANSPSAVLPALNEAILAEGGEEKFSTVAFGILELEGSSVRLTVSCAGHPLPMIRRSDGTVTRIGRPGTLLGMFPTIEVTDDSTVLGPGDAVVFFTDGVTEAGIVDRRDRRPFKFNVEQLLASANPTDAESIADRMRDAALAVQSGKPRDDIAVLVVRVLPEEAGPGTTD